MRRIRETLRLHLQANLSYNEIGRALKISKSGAGKYVSLARAAGIDGAVAQTLTDEELESRLYRPALPCSSHQLAPDFALVHQELKRAGVTLQLLWEEYARSLVGAGQQAYKYNAAVASLTASPVMGPLTNWSTVPWESTAAPPSWRRSPRSSLLSCLLAYSHALSRTQKS